jgi:hypothetical protein
MSDATDEAKETAICNAERALGRVRRALLIDDDKYTHGIQVEAIELAGLAVVQLESADAITGLEEDAMNTQLGAIRAVLGGYPMFQQRPMLRPMIEALFSQFEAATTG